MEKFFVSSKAILVNPQGKILVMRLQDGRWDLPGGRMDKNENLPQALAREIKEETGLIVDPTGAKLVYAGVFPYKGPPAESVTVIVFSLPLNTDASIVVSHEHKDFFWLDPHQPLEEGVRVSVVAILEAYRHQEGIVVASDTAIKGREGFGLIQLFTGNGKGKTTAALGESLRAKAIGKKVGIVFFDKGGETHYSERKMLDQMGIEYVVTGRDRIDPVSGRFDFSIQEIDLREAARGLQEVRRMFEEKYDVVVMDEINSTTALKMIDIHDVLTLIEQKPDRTELILTGRNAPDSFIKKAHLVTEMRLHKHYFYSGVPAREGLDY